MMDFQNKGEQFNKTVEQLISLLMNQKLMKERLGGYKELEGMRGERGVELENLRQAGDVAMQGQKHEDAMEKLRREFAQKVAQDPKIERLSSMIFMGRNEGRDMSAEGAELEKALVSTAGSMSRSFQGELDEKDAYNYLVNVSEESTRKMVGTAQDMKRMKEVDIPSMEIQKTTAETSKGNLALKWAELDVDNVKDQSTNWLKTIHRTQDHLRTEGIKEEGGMGLGALKALIGGSGRMPDPLTPENRGAAYEWLAEIEGKLNDGVLPNEIDKRFLRTVKNTFRIQGTEVKTGERGSVVSSGIPGEGMPTPETGGFTPTEFGRQQSETADRAKAEKIAEMKSKIIASAIAQGFITQDQALQYDPYFQMKAEEEYAKEMALRQR